MKHFNRDSTSIWNQSIHDGYLKMDLCESMQYLKYIYQLTGQMGKHWPRNTKDQDGVLCTVAWVTT